MQGTISIFNEDASGEAVLDSPSEHAGRRVAFDAAAFAVSGLRFLRPGQRVELDADEDGRVVAVRLPTMRGTGGALRVHRASGAGPAIG